MDIVRRTILQGLMNPLFVVELKILGHSMVNFRDRPVVFEVDLLVLDAAPKSLHEDIVERPPATIHAHAHLCSEQRSLELSTGVLDSLIGIEYFGMLNR